jgi:hypothetical protein
MTQATKAAFDLEAAYQMWLDGDEDTPGVRDAFYYGYGFGRRDVDEAEAERDEAQADLKAKGRLVAALLEEIDEDLTSSLSEINRGATHKAHEMVVAVRDKVRFVRGGE